MPLDVFYEGLEEAHFIGFVRFHGLEEKVVFRVVPKGAEGAGMVDFDAVRFGPRVPVDGGDPFQLAFQGDPDEPAPGFSDFLRFLAALFFSFFFGLFLVVPKGLDTQVQLPVLAVVDPDEAEAVLFFGGPPAHGRVPQSPVEVRDVTFVVAVPSDELPNQLCQDPAQVRSRFTGGSTQTYIQTDKPAVREGARSLQDLAQLSRAFSLLVQQEEPAGSFPYIRTREGFPAFGIQQALDAERFVFQPVEFDEILAFLAACLDDEPVEIFCDGFIM